MSLWWNLEDDTFFGYVPNSQRRHADVIQNLTYEIINLDYLLSQHIEEVLLAKISNNALSLPKSSNNILGPKCAGAPGSGVVCNFYSLKTTFLTITIKCVTEHKVMRLGESCNHDGCEICKPMNALYSIMLSIT